LDKVPIFHLCEQLGLQPECSSAGKRRKAGSGAAKGCYLGHAAETATGADTWRIEIANFAVLYSQATIILR
jgi:hypothetical protein